MDKHLMLVHCTISDTIIIILYISIALALSIRNFVSGAVSLHDSAKYTHRQRIPNDVVHSSVCILKYLKFAGIL